jgi:hypothetical protein
MSRAENTRFDSWKEVAAYLGHDIRTVRRWEKEKALPVHRIQGHRGRSVYAFRTEIDAWLLKKNEDQQLDEDREARLTNGMSAAQARAEENSQGIAPSLVTAVKSNAIAGLGSSSTPEANPRSQRITISDRPRFTSLTTSFLIILVLILSAGLIWLVFDRHASVTVEANDPTEITFVSPILPQRDQTIIIRGRGFGLHTPYKNSDTQFLALRDLTTKWAAGRIIPQNWDEVMLDVKAWEDTQIVISGFSGSYGVKGWKLSPNDQIEIAVWNPQSGRGPSTYRTNVTAVASEH